METKIEVDTTKKRIYVISDNRIIHCEPYNIGEEMDEAIERLKKRFV